jgi:hypothetical protein
MGRWAILNAVLVLILLLLGLQIARTWGRTLPPVEVAARQPDASPKAEGKPDGKGGGTRRAGKRSAPERAEQQPAVLVSTIVNKDLFDPSRQKPSEEVKAAPVKEIGPPPNLTLVGVSMVGRDREVLVTDAAQANQQRRLRVGDEVGGYTLKSVAASRVTLASAGGETITLTLAVDKSGGGVPKPPGSPTPPRPGQPASAVAPSPAAGIQPRPPPGTAAPGAPAQPRVPRAATPGVRPGAPPAPGTPPAPQPPPAPPPPPAAGGGGAAAAQPGGPGAFSNPNLPAAVREKLEQLKSK